MTETELLTFGSWILRVRKSQAEPARLLVLIHGWTGDENSMWVFTRGLSTGHWMMAPRAPYAAEPGGFSWRARQPEPRSWPDLETMRPSADGLMDLIDGYSEAAGLDAQLVDLVGFSQGAAMANLVAMLFPQRVRKVAVLAGFVPSGVDELIAKKTLAGKHIFVAHGTKDKMVPVDFARKSIELLEQAGSRVTYCEDEVGHKVSAACLRALENYLQD